MAVSETSPKLTPEEEVLVDLSGATLRLFATGHNKANQNTSPDQISQILTRCKEMSIPRIKVERTLLDATPRDLRPTYLLFIKKILPAPEYEALADEYEEKPISPV